MSRMHCRSVWVAIAQLTLFLSVLPSQAAEENLTAEQIQFFESKIRPVLIAQCYGCHSSQGQGIKGGLSVENRDGLLAGGESGPAIVPHDLDASLLWNAINYRDIRMPPRKPLPKEAIEDFRRWIEMGAPDPRVGTVASIRSSVTEEDIAEGRNYWAFKPPRYQPPPTSSLKDWSKSEIDSWIAAKLDEQGLKPAADTDAATLLRRLYFDLIGLPPTPEQRAEFARAYAKDPAKAIETTVDELLDRPQFGERWGRHWLDVARYAESTGKEIDMSFPHAWRYRNYVIDAFNADKPYDQFVREQIAGDLLPATSDAEWAEHLIATGFLALGPKALIEQNPRQFQADLIDEQIDVTTRVFLGVSVACARCHDHKFDPIPQADYYAMAGIFQSTETFYGGARTQRNRQPSNLIILPIDDPNPNDTPLSPDLLRQLKEELTERESQLVEARRAQRMPQAANAKGANDPRRAFLNVNALEQIVVQLSNKIHSVDESGKPLTFCMGVQDASAGRNARLLVRGEIDQPAQEIPRGFVQVLSPAAQSNFSSKGSGRLELAGWMTDRNNPLLARVMVNRIWQHLMGQAIVRELENFGSSGPGPTHAELLDVLAVQFMEKGWSIKEMIREITRSRTYRLSSEHDPIGFEKDPDNFYLARANRQRLDAESMRDTMLFISGQLDAQRPKASPLAEYGSTLIGPTGPVSFPIPMMVTNPSGDMRARPEVMEALRGNGRPGLFAANANLFEMRNYHRSVYLPVARNALPRALDAFDFAEPSMVIGQRETSNTADQALYLLNNPFVLEQSDALARRLIQYSPQMEERVAYAFQLAYGREATAAELRASLNFLRQSASQMSERPSDQRPFAVLSQLCQALFSSAEFRYVN